MKSLRFCLMFGLVSQFAMSGEPRVVLISLDGGADYMVDDLLARGVLPPDGAFARMLRRGVSAEHMNPVNVSGTPVAHTSMFTGASPQATGVPGNNFLMLGDPVRKRTRGFGADLEAETLWQSAMAQGLGVLCGTAVAADGRGPERSCTLTLGFGQTLARPVMAEMLAGQAEDWILGDEVFEHHRALITELNQPVFWKFRSGAEMPIHALAVDRLQDGETHFDAVYLDFDRDLSNGYAAFLTPETWTTLTLRAENKDLGSRVLLRRLSPDLSQVSLYLGALTFTPGGPGSYLQEIRGEIGPWPGDADHANFHRKRISEAMWLDQSYALAHYIRDMVLMGLQRDDWRLMLTYLPTVDNVQHHFMVRDPRQADYAAENGQRRKHYAELVERAYIEADAIMGQWLDAAPDDVNFMLVSDHGVAPTHSVILMNQFLADAGFQVRAEGDTDVWAHTTGPAAHIYVNLKGRQAGGTVPEDQLDAYVDRILKACREAKDPITGLPIFQVALRKSELGDLKLGHPQRAGDVFVNARPGWSLSSRMAQGVPATIPNSYNMDVIGDLGLSKEIQAFLEAGNLNETGVGVHGHLAGNREVQAIFYAVGPHIPNRRIGEISALDVAPTIAAILGINPPKQAEGKPVFRPVR